MKSLSCIALTAALFATLLTRTGAASPTSIGVFFAPDASVCNASLALGTVFNVYVMVVLGTDGAGVGITGAELRVSGFEAAWFPRVTANPVASLTAGDPLGNASFIAFEVCQPAGPVLLYTIQCFLLPPTTAHTFRVERALVPNEHDFSPLVTLCDAPVYTKIACRGGQAFLNGRSCTVNLMSDSWGSVKQLFRE